MDLCNSCILSNSREHNIVNGIGPTPCSLALIGEAPGAEEDYVGQPFIGKAGKCLTHILAKVSLQRSDVFLTNILRCRPPGNVLPKGKKLLELINTCRPWLEKELDKVQPKVIVLLGNIPLLAFTGKWKITNYEGLEVGEYHGAKLIASFHPSYCLRRPGEERKIASVLLHAAQHVGLQAVMRDNHVPLFDYGVA